MRWFFGGHLRLIPARAGNTSWCETSGSMTTAHPRSRGEHFYGLDKAAWFIGSSPLARGTLLADGDDGLRYRLIPARAGNTSVRLPFYAAFSAHPRSRGEHSYISDKKVFFVGSSPLARGTLKRVLWVDGVDRLIPARAGNTPFENPTRGCRPAHPRSRGEHFASARQSLEQSGSSPLARGTLGWRECRDDSCRLIPARAGNTRTYKSRHRKMSAHPRSRGEHLSGLHGG